MRPITAVVCAMDYISDSFHAFLLAPLVRRQVEAITFFSRFDGRTEYHVSERFANGAGLPTANLPRKLL